MARRKNKGRKGAQRGPDLFQQAQQSLAKGQAKAALKDAKLCYKQKQSDERRELLERAYVARVKNLIELGMQDEGRNVAKELLSFGPRMPETSEKLPEILVQLGMFREASEMGAGGAANGQGRLLAASADQAVLHPEQSMQAPEEIRAGAEKVRKALSALEQSQDETALQLLSDIPRASPFADWKLFVRGLLAYYRQDYEQMEANWRRLDTGRAAARIADPLRVFSSDTKEDSWTVRQRDAHRAIASAAADGPVASRLAEIEEFAAGGKWDKAAACLVKSRETFRRFSPHLMERVVDVLAGNVLRDENAAALNKLSRGVPGPAIDPTWHRTLALMAERNENPVEVIASHWRRYLEELPQRSSFSPQDRRLVESLVEEHLGNQWMSEAAAIRSEANWDPFDEEDEEDELQDAIRHEERAVECFRRSVELTPERTAGYDVLATALRVMGREEESIEAWRRLLARVPDHFEACMKLGEHHVRQDEPLKALPYYKKAHQLKPLDKAVARQLAAAHLGAARHFALRKDWPAGREAFETAARLAPEFAGQYHMLCRRGLFEMRAGQTEEAEQILDQARGKLQEPTAALLVLSIEAKRYGLSSQQCKDFNRQWKKALKKRCQSETAAAMCEIMNAYMRLAVAYPGRGRDVEDVLAYLRRCKQVKWNAADLVRVCDFLSHVPSEEESLERYTKKGIREFSDTPYFTVESVMRGMRGGPRVALYRLPEYRKQLHQVIEKLEGSNEPLDVEVRERAKSVQSMMEMLGRFSGPFIDPFDDDWDEDEEDEEDEEDDFEDDYAGPSQAFFSFFAGADEDAGRDDDE